MLLTDSAPTGIFDYSGVEFVLPQHRDRLALRVVIDTSSVDKGRVAKPRRQVDRLDQPAALSHVNELPRLGRWGRCVQ